MDTLMLTNVFLAYLGFLVLQSGFYITQAGYVRSATLDGITIIPSSGCVETHPTRLSQSCDFDHGLCTLSFPKPYDDFRWRISNSTKFSGVNTLHEGSFAYPYLFGVNIGMSAALNTTSINSGSVCVRFLYAMARHFSNLEVLAITDDGNKTTLWQRNGSQGSMWNEATVAVHAQEPFKIVFKYTKFSDVGIIAIDDVNIWSYHSPTTTPTTTTPTTTPDWCAATPCYNGGSCMDAVDKAICVCAGGFTGNHCTNDIDECSGPNVCTTDSVCVNTNGSYECLTCAGITCLHNGTCSLGWNYPKCSCPPAWAGKYCEVPNHCITNRCGLYMRCQHLADGYECHELHDLCANSPCQHGGTCRQTGKHVICDCFDGYTGPLCDVRDFCNSQPCANGATCVNHDDDTFSCSCRDGWTGATCENKDMCQNITCFYGGHCSSYFDTFHCFCHKEWAGMFCERTNHCACSPCHHGGNCTDSRSGVSCQCPSGWTGRVCDVVDFCAVNPCQGGSTCHNEKTSFYCTCAPGRTGRLCDVTYDLNVCISSPCQHKGKCEIAMNSSVCYCLGGYEGNVCQTDIDECLLNFCPASMICNNTQGGYRCDDLLAIGRRSLQSGVLMVTNQQIHMDSSDVIKVLLPEIITNDTFTAVEEKIEELFQRIICPYGTSTVRIWGFHNNISMIESTVDTTATCDGQPVGTKNVDLEFSNIGNLHEDNKDMPIDWT